MAIFCIFVSTKQNNMPKRKSLVGKYVLEHWVNGDFIHRCLRHINRENDKYYISDVQRAANYSKEPTTYTHLYKWATKFFKDPKSELGFRRSVTNQSNTEGVMEYTVMDSPAECKCPYKFEEIFDVDIRTIQSKNDNPLMMKNEMWKDKDTKKRFEGREAEFFKIRLMECGTEKKDFFGSTHDYKSTERMKKMFHVKHVYRICEMASIDEHPKQTILSKSGTLFHMLHSTDKKVVTSDISHENRTITFWLFDDKLVYQYDSGKSTW